MVAGEYYFDRKGNYSLNGSFVVDANTRILQCHLGCNIFMIIQVLIQGSGQSHDAAVWKQLPLSQHLELHFEDQAGYIIGDSAYPLDNWLIKPFV